MKRITITLMMGTTLLFAAVIAPGRAADQEIDRRHVKTVEVRNVTPRGGKNIALEIAINPPPGVKLPRGISALVNGGQVHLYDDGRWPDERAGDGVYSAAAATKNGQPLNDKATLRLQSNSLFEPSALAPKFSCTLKIVECPSNCKSSIFQTRCVVCISVQDCELTI